MIKILAFISRHTGLSFRELLVMADNLKSEMPEEEIADYLLNSFHLNLSSFTNNKGE